MKLFCTLVVFMFCRLVFAGLPILQGLTTDSSTQFSILSKQRNLRFQVVLAADIGGSKIQAQKAVATTQTGSDWIAYQAYFEQLQNQEYMLQVVDDQGVVIEERQFGLLDQGQKEIVFALASCMSDSDKFAYEHQHMWKALLDSDPDVLFLIGDNVYADVTSSPMNKTTIWEHYVRTRQRLYLFHSSRLIPTMATWDDHDYGENNSGRKFKYKNAAREVFDTMYAQHDPFGVLSFHLDRGPGISSFFNYAGFDFYLMDNRSFRAKHESSPEHWGRTQSQWLNGHLASRPNHAAFIFSGSQFFTNNLFIESYWREHRKELKQNLKFWSKLPKVIAFGSGDVHYSEVSRLKSLLPYRTYELTSSAMHSSFHGAMPNNKRIALNTESNFLLVQAKGTGQRMELDVKSIGLHSKIDFHLPPLIVEL